MNDLKVKVSCKEDKGYIWAFIYKEIKNLHL